ncbi:MAG: tyrosine--tRNA ligase [Bacilli bacterium]|nr:tyrosine--tRNA ligase [Bacilli bacterium]
MQIFEELQRRGLIAQVTDEPEIKELINNGGAKFYIGFDPTADSLHVGHFMTIVLMKRLQLAGNKPIVLLGGGTGLIGDPSGRTDMRNVLSIEQVNHNCECFKKQIGKFIEFGEDKAICVNNGDWLRDLKYIEVLRDVGACFSVNKMLSAECYKQRMERGLSFLEFNYMIMQSYDFYRLHEDYGCNMEFGGDDQWSNMLGGTELIRKKTGKDAYCLTIPLLTTADGKKMGKSAKGAVWLDKDKYSVYDFYQFWRNVADADVIKFMKVLTFIPIEEIEEMEKWDGSRINELKEMLAMEITTMVHSKEEAEKARDAAKALFSGAGDDSNMPTSEITIEGDDAGILDVLLAAKLIPSKGEGRRLIEQGGISMDDEKVTNPNMRISRDQLTTGIKIRKGKKVFQRIIVK